MELASHIHIFATVLGVICAMVSAFLMLNLKTADQIRKRGDITRSISPFTWIAFIALIISGIVITLHAENINYFILGIKHLLVTVLLVDALFIHFRYFPRFFRQIGTPEFNKTYTTMRRIGALSVSCWTIILVLSFALDHLA